MFRKRDLFLFFFTGVLYSDFCASQPASSGQLGLYLSCNRSRTNVIGEKERVEKKAGQFQWRETRDDKDLLPLL